MFEVDKDPFETSNISDFYNAAALKSNNDLYIWGLNGRGQLGNGYMSISGRLERTPHLILENVKEYKIDLSNETYYPCAAISLNDELYVWGKLYQPSENAKVDIGGGDIVETSVDVFNPEQKKMSPVKKLDNVESFELQKDGVLAKTYDGKSVLVNNTPEVKNNKGTKTDYRNTKGVNNIWEPVFDSVMVSLQGSYDGNKLENIHGTIKNNLSKSWNNCALTFILYDQWGESIDQITIFLDAADIGEQKKFSSKQGDSLFRYNAFQFKLVEVNPNVMR